MTPDAVPEVTRVLLHVEWSDGSVREVAAERPARLDLEVSAPVLRDLTPWGDPHAIVPSQGPASVSLAFRADYRWPVVLRDHSTIGTPVGADAAPLDS